MSGLKKRIEKTEQEMGEDTTVIRGIADFIRYTDKLKKGIGVSKVMFKPNLAKLIRRATQNTKG